MQKETSLRYLGHLGSIFFNIGIVGLLLIIGIVISPIMWLILLALLLLIALFGSVLSAGMIWTVEPFKKFMGHMFSLLEDNSFFTSIMAYIPSIPVIASITGVFLAAATVFLFFNRSENRSLNRLRAILVLFVIFLVMVILIALGVTMGGGVEA